MIEQIQRVITNIIERVGTQGAAKESLGTPARRNERGSKMGRFDGKSVLVTGGLMYPSDRPGLGIELNEEAAKAHPKADHWLRYYAGTLTDIRPPDSVAYYGC